MKTTVNEAADKLLEAPPEYTAVDVPQGQQPYGEPDIRIYRVNPWRPGDLPVTRVVVQRYPNVDGMKAVTRSTEIRGRLLPDNDPEVQQAIAKLLDKVNAEADKSRVTQLDRTPTFVAPFQLIDKVRDLVEPYDYVRCVSGNTQSTHNTNSEAVAGLARRVQPGQQMYRILTSHGKPQDYMDRACIYFNATPEEAEVVHQQLDRLGRQRAKKQMGIS